MQGTLTLSKTIPQITPDITISSQSSFNDNCVEISIKLKTSMSLHFFPGKLKYKGDSWCFLHYEPQASGYESYVPAEKATELLCCLETLKSITEPHNCSIFELCTWVCICLSDNHILFSLGKYSQSEVCINVQGQKSSK